MKTIALVLALTTLPLLGGKALAASESAATATRAAEAGRTADSSARKKVRHHRHVHRSYRHSYGYYPYGQGYYRGIRPGWGYGPDRGDYAWPPFHFKPYY